MEELARKDFIFLENVSRIISCKHRMGSGIFFRKLPGGTHEEWLFEGLFEELVFDGGARLLKSEREREPKCRFYHGEKEEYKGRLLMKRGFDRYSLSDGMG